MTFDSQLVAKYLYVSRSNVLNKASSSVVGLNEVIYLGRLIS